MEVSRRSLTQGSQGLQWAWLRQRSESYCRRPGHAHATLNPDRLRRGPLQGRGNWQLNKQGYKARVRYNIQ